jgi:hypothetical protein
MSARRSQNIVSTPNGEEQTENVKQQPQHFKRPERKFGSRGGRVNRVSRREGETSQIAPPLPKLPPGTKLEPKALATVPTPLKNDPMWIDFEDHGFSGLTPYRGENTFASTLEGFCPIVDRDYDLIGSVDRTFTKFVSKSMWIYYNVQHLFARLIAIRRHEWRASYEDHMKKSDMLILLDQRIIQFQAQ